MENRIDAIYARQSVDRKDSISVDCQIEFCKYELRGENYKDYKAGPVKIGLNQKHSTARRIMV